MIKRRKIIFGILGVMVLIAIVVVLFLGIKSKDAPNKNKEDNTTSTMGNYEILSCKSKDDVESFLKKNEIEHVYEDEYCYIYGMDVFDNAVDVEIFFENDDIKRISVFFSLLEIPYPTDGIVDAEEDVEFEYIPHDFTEDEKLQAQDAFSNVKDLFQEYLTCGEFAQYDIVPVDVSIMSEATEMSEDEQFYKGYTMKEYSVKDEEGILWLLDYSASEYNASAKIIKILDTTGFDGFIPNIDMTKKEEGEK